MSETEKENLVNDSDNSADEAEVSEFEKSDEEASELGSVEEPEESDIEEDEDIDIENPDSQVQPPPVESMIENIKVSETQSADLPIITSSSQADDGNYTSGSDDEYDEDYLQKFDEELKKDYLVECHPEEVADNYDQITAMSKITRNKDGIVIDALHKSLPILTKYEYTNVLGLRAKQINAGAKIFVKADNIIDGYIIAQMEIRKKKLPFIIRRPLPNGGSEYWKLKDLEILM